MDRHCGGPTGGSKFVPMGQRCDVLKEVTQLVVGGKPIRAARVPVAIPLQQPHLYGDGVVVVHVVWVWGLSVVKGTCVPALPSCSFGGTSRLFLRVLHVLQPFPFLSALCGSSCSTPLWRSGSGGCSDACLLELGLAGFLPPTHLPTCAVPSFRTQYLLAQVLSTPPHPPSSPLPPTRTRLGQWPGTLTSTILPPPSSFHPSALLLLIPIVTRALPSPSGVPPIIIIPPPNSPTHRHPPTHRMPANRTYQVKTHPPTHPNPTAPHPNRLLFLYPPTQAIHPVACSNRLLFLYPPTHPPTHLPTHPPTHPPTHMKPTAAHSNRLDLLYHPVNSTNHPPTHPDDGSRRARLLRRRRESIVCLNQLSTHPPTHSPEQRIQTALLSSTHPPTSSFLPKPNPQGQRRAQRKPEQRRRKRGGGRERRSSRRRSREWGGCIDG